MRESDAFVIARLYACMYVCACVRMRVCTKERAHLTISYTKIDIFIDENSSGLSIVLRVQGELCTRDAVRQREVDN